ncbi:hypothetical protein [Pendulispora albinea]|uniref:Uncharacterized protein n=1 Tax=Pendulispora albinea TaxID=2741071 RepID=A0ABZ2LRV1_9BACT
MSERKGNGTGVSARLARVKEIAAEVAIATATLNESLERIERGLVTLKLGISHVIEISSEADKSDGEQVFLSFEKGHAWGFYVHRIFRTTEEEASTKPLRLASRTERLLAADKLEDLVCGILEKAGNQLIELKATSVKISILADILDTASSNYADSEIPF